MQQQPRSTLPHPKRAGLTLIELMVVVLIMGILAMISIPKYTAYLYRSKTTEAVGFLADIKARQEAYKSEYFQYCSVSAAATDYWPAGTPTSHPRNWGTPPATSGWAQLGVRPPSLQVYFAYQCTAGAPGTTPAGGLGYDGSDFWFVSRAIGDLDGDSTMVTFESYSARPTLYISESKGWE
jgi:prepilin-type N-terminal cleavage/methylation domain-containing protein